MVLQIVCFLPLGSCPGASTYRIIDNSDKPCFANVPELNGVGATGHTIEDARRELIGVLEKWIAARLACGLPIPPIGGQSIKVL